VPAGKPWAEIEACEEAAMQVGLFFGVQAVSDCVHMTADAFCAAVLSSVGLPGVE
jgi:hypothetical protein